MFLYTFIHISYLRETLRQDFFKERDTFSHATPSIRVALFCLLCLQFHSTHARRMSLLMDGANFPRISSRLYESYAGILLLVSFCRSVWRQLRIEIHLPNLQFVFGLTVHYLHHDNHHGQREREYIFSPGAVHFQLFTYKLINFYIISMIPNAVNERAKSAKKCCSNSRRKF